MIQDVPSLVDFGAQFGITAVVSLVVVHFVHKAIKKKISGFLEEHESIREHINDIHKECQIRKNEIISSKETLTKLLEKISARMDSQEGIINKLCSTERCPALAKIDAGCKDIARLFTEWTAEAKESRENTTKEIKEIHSRVTNFTETVGVEMIHALRESRNSNSKRSDS